MKFLSKHAPAMAAVLLLTLLAQGSVVHAQSAGQDVNEQTFRRIANRLMCQCGGCNYSALSCNHINCASAEYITKTVRKDLAAGQTEDIIMASLVSEYGPRILAEPPREGFTWLGWIMPYVALLLGGGAVALVLWRWQGSSEEEDDEEVDAGLPDSKPQSHEQAASLVEKYRAEIDRELAKD
jgi:cytochrome c-type biogenesis protein CcmH/NrfF